MNIGSALISYLTQGKYLAALAYVLSTCAIVFFILPVHEYAHAFTADKLGDRTARFSGRLTLNPMEHVDWLGAVMILLFGIGWAKPVPINPNNFKKPKWGMALTAVAGPVSNVIVGFVAMIGYAGALKIIMENNLFEGTLSVVMYLLTYVFAFVSNINFALAVFNILPVPPLDGSRLLMALLPDRIYYKIMQYERFIMIGLILLLFLGVFSTPLYYLRYYMMVGCGKVIAPIFGFSGNNFYYFIQGLL